MVLVNLSAPGTTYPGGPVGGTATDSLARALNYSAELQTTSIMQYVINFDPQLQQRGYTANDLIADVVPNTSTTAATITLLATARHPADAVLLANDVANGFAAYITSQVQNQLNATTASLKAQINSEQQVQAGWEAKIAALPSTTTGQYAVYSSELADATRTLDALKTQLQQLPATVKGDAFVIQLATPGDVTASNKGYVIIGVTAGVGLLVGFLIMLLLIFLDNRLRSDEQVKEKLGMAYLGGLSNNNQVKEAPVRVKGDLLHEISDIGTNLHLTSVLPGPWQAPRGVVLLITSPRAAEGKTTLAAVLSAALARGGASVLVIDGNLRRPSTHLAFKVNGAGPGLSGLLKGTGTESAHDAVVRSSVPGVWLLPAGPAVEDTTLLLGQRLPGILAQLRKGADIVIIDGPALLSGADASLLATMSDGIALVIDARHEKLPLLLRAKELLSSLTHTPAGIIMNRLATKRGSHYYASAYLGDAAAERWIPIQAHVSNGAGIRHADPVFDIAPVPSPNTPMLPAQSNMQPLPGPSGIFSPNRPALPSLPGIVPQPLNDIAKMQQNAPAPSPRPAPNAGIMTPPMPPRSWNG